MIKKILTVSVLSILFSLNSAYANISMIGSDDFWLGFAICVPIFLFTYYHWRKDDKLHEIDITKKKRKTKKNTKKETAADIIRKAK
tara:strand:+ start:130 stop:387 length:258 start_codon:yes stop_codon:yes gene_type:complete